MEDGYGLDARFELAVLHSCCTRPGFWKRVGGQLDPKRMGHRWAPVVLAACRLLTLETGRSPSSTITVMQRVRRWHEEGKLKLEDVQAVAELFDQAEDAGVPPEDELVAELVPVVRRKMQSEAVIAANDEFARRGDFSTVTDIVHKASRLGEVVAFEDAQLSSDLSVLEDDGAERLKTPIHELTLALEGGLPRRSEAVVIADSGGGKSMFLVSQAAVSAHEGKHVLVASLELPYRTQLGRLIANLTGVPVNDVLGNPAHRARAARLLDETRHGRGPVSVAEFAPHATTVRDLVDWVDQKEQREGRKVDVLIVDYADKLWDPRAKDGNEYVAMRYVYEGLRRDLAVERDMWVWTASQPGRRNRKEAKAFLDLSDVADSMHKVRVADLVLTANYQDQDDFSQVELFIAKNRHGRARFSVGPFPTDFARARFCAHPTPGF